MTRFVIYTPLYRENSGGIIVLHKLASLLRAMGHDVKIWPQQKPAIYELATVPGWKKAVLWAKWRALGLLGRKDLRSPYRLSVARHKDINDSIVLYPEIVAGNPLRSSKVVRWLLNKPGAISGVVDFGENDLFFFYQEKFNDWALNPDTNNRLTVTELMSDTYVSENTGTRNGQCYMVRKGKNRALDYHDKNAVRVDGVSHKELAKIFNECKYFICYDPYTMYCRYAAMCGCIPVVVPENGVTKEEWRPEIYNRYGIAYGWDDVPWAVETRPQLMEFLSESERRNEELARNFVATVEKRFSD
ncbi:hypothetical protein QPM17_03460 [Marinobacter sp. TBZ242]|uniref:Glycosyltransferase n=1 Tax=Marinobacter azerbaijanicus TaxID=3050455 RepID=A0ABT7I7M9_9GAMM|nr:hypothetical protein [Marinobacter sp. TBZ242]MDL0430166.1 hypothetical protein [Marinobacter sp. TBZ242]